ncbi:MAG: DMT family transporter [Glaciecola sp.]|nr:DMT family transporter [Glaciecola sp.]MDG1467821.1 DMT family transporter [Glaciecola sp.]
MFTTWMYSAVAMLAFAGNSVLCRWALADTSIDPASFTVIRLISGSVFLVILVYVIQPFLQSSPSDMASASPTGPAKLLGSWSGAIALFAYAACFSFAYISLSAATGALLLFGSVQITMIGFSLWRGERLNSWQITGVCSAIIGLGIMFLPSATTPGFLAGGLMSCAGIAWGVYSILGKQAGNPTLVTTGNFIRASILAIVLGLLSLPYVVLDNTGIILAIVSGALASGAGYAIWYAVLPRITSTQAATMQLSVPVIASFGGLLLLNEAIALSFVVASFAILGGIALVIKRA